MEIQQIPMRILLNPCEKKIFENTCILSEKYALIASLDKKIKKIEP